MVCYTVELSNKPAGTVNVSNSVAEPSIIWSAPLTIWIVNPSPEQGRSDEKGQGRNEKYQGGWGRSRDGWERWIAMRNHEGKDQEWWQICIGMRTIYSRDRWGRRSIRDDKYCFYSGMKTIKGKRKKTDKEECQIWKRMRKITEREGRKTIK